MIKFSVTSAPSAIEGTGVYAAVAIPRRAKIGEITGDLIPIREARKRAKNSRRIYLIDVSETRALDCSKGNTLRHLNHSCGSNAFLRIIKNRVEVYALRDIRADEEITVNYGETPHKGGMICVCGHPSCRNII